MEKKIIDHWNDCDKCGKPFDSPAAFRIPQVCPKCSKLYEGEEMGEILHAWRASEGVDQDDLYQALEYNPECGLGVEDIEGILAEIPGANEELEWHWIVKRKAPHSETKYVYICGSCCYSGWGVSGKISVCKYAHDAMNATDFAPCNEESDGKVGRTNIRKQLQAQLNGKQPYATYRADFTASTDVTEIRRAEASVAGVRTLVSSASVCMSSDEAPVKVESPECRGCEGKGWVENSRGMPFKCPLCGGCELG